MGKESENSSLECCRDLLEVLEDIGKQDHLTLGRLLHQRLQSPQAFVTMVGETSTGKTTLINGLIGNELLPTSASPTTATVTHVVLGDEQEPRFLAINKDGTQDVIGREKFVALALKPDNELFRLRVETRAIDSDVRGLNVFDTPGYNAMIAEHEEILCEFLPESDVVVFVCGYRTGFGQIDQDLLEIVRKATAHDPALPYVLVVNRIPAKVSETDKRVQEIVENATDCLARRPQVILVASPPISDSGVREYPPDSVALWRLIVEHVQAPTRQVAVETRLRVLLGQLIQEAHGALVRERLTLTASEEELKDIERDLDEVRNALESSMESVRRSTSRLALQMRPAIERASENLVKKLSREIDESEKWLGREDCVAWLHAHSLPFSVTETSKEMERVIAEELERLDKELLEIANSAISKIQRQVAIRSDVPDRMAQNLAVALAKRVGGQAVGNSLKGLGGVGGVAAGAGNLVKMGVKRFGALVGQKFGREVYNTIGRIFTKRVVTSAAAILSIAIDAGMFIYDAKTWQKALKKTVAESIGKWKDELVVEVYQRQLPQIEKANEDGVRETYEGLLAEHVSTLGARSRDVAPRVAKLETSLSKLTKLKSRLVDNLEVS